MHQKCRKRFHYHPNQAKSISMMNLTPTSSTATTAVNHLRPPFNAVQPTPSSSSTPPSTATHNGSNIVDLLQDAASRKKSLTRPSSAATVTAGVTTTLHPPPVASRLNSNPPGKSSDGKSTSWVLFRRAPMKPSATRPPSSTRPNTSASYRRKSTCCQSYSTTTEDEKDQRSSTDVAANEVHDSNSALWRKEIQGSSKVYYEVLNLFSLFVEGCLNATPIDNNSSNTGCASLGDDRRVLLQKKRQVLFHHHESSILAFLHQDFTLATQGIAQRSGAILFTLQGNSNDNGGKKKESSSVNNVLLFVLLALILNENIRLVVDFLVSPWGVEQQGKDDDDDQISGLFLSSYLYSLRQKLFLLLNRETTALQNIMLMMMSKSTPSSSAIHHQHKKQLSFLYFRNFELWKTSLNSNDNKREARSVNDDDGEQVQQQFFAARGRFVSSHSPPISVFKRVEIIDSNDSTCTETAPRVNLSSSSSTSNIRGLHQFRRPMSAQQQTKVVKKQPSNLNPMVSSFFPRHQSQEEKEVHVRNGRENVRNSSDSSLTVGKVIHFLTSALTHDEISWREDINQNKHRSSSGSSNILENHPPPYPHRTIATLKLFSQFHSSSWVKHAGTMPLQALISCLQSAMATSSSTKRGDHYQSKLLMNTSSSIGIQNSFEKNGQSSEDNGVVESLIRLLAAYLKVLQIRWHPDKWSSFHQKQFLTKGEESRQGEEEEEGVPKNDCSPVTHLAQEINVLKEHFSQTP